MHLQGLARVLIGLWNAHESAQLQARQILYGLRQFQCLSGRHARFVGAAINVDLQADL